MTEARQDDVLRIANCSGFYGDRLSAAREMVEGGPIDVLTGDWLAELTMLLLGKAMLSGRPGYARTFLTQLEQVLPTCLERGIKIVSNAGGLDPAGCAAAVQELASRAGLNPVIAHVTGDDLLPRIAELQGDGHHLANLDTGETLAEAGIAPLTAHAYLGGLPIAQALHAGADVVITGRVTDAALVVGPGMWRFGWEGDDLDALAGAVVTGHVLECGCQATGGNYAFFRKEVNDLAHAGFPLAELAADGSSVITKHPGTGGLVSVGTVTAQLLYEIGPPAYANPDVIARFDTIALEQVGPDRVRVSGVRGEPPPADLKVGLNYAGGYRNSMALVLEGLDIAAKAQVAEQAIWARVPGGKESFGTVDVDLVGADPALDWQTPAARSADGRPPIALLRISVLDEDKAKVGRAFSAAVVETGLASYPGFYALSPPGDASAYGVYWPTRIPAGLVTTTVVIDGEKAWTGPARSEPGQSVAAEQQARAATPPTARAGNSAPTAPSVSTEATPSRGAEGADPPEPPAVLARGDDPPEPPAVVRVPLGTVAGARSGDKGGNANLGVWVRTPAEYAWLERYLTADRLAELVSGVAGLSVERYCLPNLFAINFVIVGLLDRGVAASTRLDPQAKALGEHLRAAFADVPTNLLPPAT
ncbi:MAG TPA: acyclic terpene utilization AtuA family protein [Streptosporangiaceae bacterium]|nr:acyclic terpene utilization AtuA family protein [Streptosporangiaceae bacterium]